MPRQECALIRGRVIFLAQIETELGRHQEQGSLCSGYRSSIKPYCVGRIHIRCVVLPRYGGDHPDAFLRRAIPVHGLRPAYRESLRDIAASRSTHRNSIWASAGPRRWPMWRIHAALAQRLITQARTLAMGLDLTNTVYERPSLCACRSTSAPPRRCTRCSTCAIPSPHLGWQAARRSCPRLLPEAGAITSWIVATSTLPAFMCCTKPGPSSSRVQVEHRSSRLFGADRSTGIICDQTISLDGFYTRSPNFCGASASRTPSPARRWSSSPFSPGRHHLRALQKPLAGGTLLQVDQAGIKQFYGTSENAVKEIWIAVSVYVLVAKEAPRHASLYTLLQPLGDPLPRTCGRRKQMQRFANNQPIEFIRFLTGH